jgi:hypothetical protein
MNTQKTRVFQKLEIGVASPKQIRHDSFLMETLLVRLQVGKQ